jgi:hypothetical protein
MDGGYYAIKGFEFQIDKTILEILGTEDDVCPENIQDINTNSIVIQVKYKETQDYSDNKIREPVLQLIEEFKKDTSKKYKLFCYFSNKNEGEEIIDIVRLNSILTLSTGKTKKAKKLNDRITAIDEKLKNEFIKNFCISYAKEYEEQFNQVIKILQEEDFIGNSYDEAIFYYSNITNFLRKLVIQTTEPTERICSRKQILNHLRNGKKNIFDSSFREYKGDQEYYKLVKKKNFTFANIDDFERFIILDMLETESVSDIKQVVLLLKKRFCVIPNRGDIKSGSPYIHIKGISESMLIILKKELLSEGCFFKDGHDFYKSNFSTTILKKPTTKENKIFVKFINTKEHLVTILREDLGKTKEIYQFFINDEIDIEDDIKHIKIKINRLSDITYII